jgi:UDP-3-O-[3-hydroxymyristoyl] N-acetylglucosamine deacetylase / 3-hydroxyacyl-[acyl-carrier-protein] dehydratase
MYPRNILTSVVEFEGIGLHTGALVKMSIIPADEGSGIRFRRTDIDNDGATILADASLVTATQRGTTLTSENISVSTIEHVLAAINALDIDDVTIAISGPEVPILDGSSQGFYDKMVATGLKPTESTREPFVVTEAFDFVDEISGSSYSVFPCDHLEITAILDFPQDSLGEMAATMKSKADFGREIAKCRTFVFLSEVEKLYESGLIKGGDLDNAIVVVDRYVDDNELNRLRIKLEKPNIAISADGLLNHINLRFKNEPARHKVLDIIGDLTLVGRDVKAKIIAHKPGHTGNVALAKLLKAKYLEYKRTKGVPIYDPTGIPVMTVEDIKGHLPHRYPFLMVDKVVELTSQYIIGIKNVTFNENFFQGHFPGNPIFPGVLQMEALAQTGGIFALSLMEDKGQWDTYFLKMDNVKFKAKVVPGDTLILRMELMSPIRRGIVQMLGTAYVGNKLVSEGELTAQIVKRIHD